MTLSRAWRLTAAFLLALALWACVGAHRQMFGLGPSQAQAASLLPNGKQTFVDANGVPLAGGSVFFYIPNTLTLKTTWLDFGQTTPNSNPVILDSAGRAVIYGSGAYRQIVKDQFGNQIWDQLSIDSSNPGILTGGTSTGTGNAQVISALGFSSQNGQAITFIAGFTNTGATTLNPGTGPIPVVRDTSFGPLPLAGREIVANNQIMVVYDSIGGTFHLVAVPPTGENAPGTLTITPTQLTVNTDDWNPTGLAGAAVIRVNANANININGILAQPAGTVITLINVGGFSVVLPPQQTTSAAANRFAFPRQELIQPGQALKIIYDGTLNQWVLDQATESVLLPTSSRRQTVASGPSAGFIPASSGTLSLTMTGVSPTSPLNITAAFGFSISGSVDYWCQVIGNQTFSSLPANTTLWLIETVNTDGTCTPGNTVLQPLYQFGGAISVTAGQYTFDYQHYQMWLGNGATAAQVAVVVVGDALTGVSTVITATPYAYNGHFESSSITPGACPQTITAQDNIGVISKNIKDQYTNVTTNLGYNPGAIVLSTSITSEIAAGPPVVYAPVSVSARNDGKSVAETCGSVATNRFILSTAGVQTVIVNADWSQQFIVDRQW